MENAKEASESFAETVHCEEEEQEGAIGTTADELHSSHDDANACGDNCSVKKPVDISEVPLSGNITILDHTNKESQCGGGDAPGQLPPSTQSNNASYQEETEYLHPLQNDMDLLLLSTDEAESRLQATLTDWLSMDKSSQNENIISSDGNSSDSDRTLPRSLPEEEEDRNLNLLQGVSDSSNFWRGDQVHSENTLYTSTTHLPVLKGIPYAKPIHDWSAAVEEDYIGENFPYRLRVGNDNISGINLEPEAYESEAEKDVTANIPDDDDDDDDEDDSKKTSTLRIPTEGGVRIRYTRNFLLKFCDCILAYAFPEGLRQFTKTGELPLKQLEVPLVQETRPPYVNNRLGGMEHILFYNDMHFVSNSKRYLVKF